MTASAPVRFGVLGAARITPTALLAPAAEVADARVDVIAARDPDRAEAFARAHGIPRVVRSYEELVADPDIDAVYIALPLALHHRWTLAALAAGKHVLCEKPLACNAAEAEHLGAAAAEAGRVLCEAGHWRYHPLAARIAAVVADEAFGAVRHVLARFDAPIDAGDIRYQLALGGGAAMDLGCYPVQWARFVTDEEPEVTSAEVVERIGDVDVAMAATLRFPSGAQATLSCAMNRPFAAGLVVEGDYGLLSVTNPLAPHLGHKLTVRLPAQDEGTESVAGCSTYRHQLDAFVAAVRHGRPLPTDAVDAAATLRVLDAVYRAAGLPVRTSSLCRE